MYGLFLLLCLFTFRPGQASDALLSFQFGKLGAAKGGSASFLGQFSWTPRLKTSFTDLRGELGLTFFKAPDGNLFPVVNYEVFLTGNLKLVLIELGGGLQTWSQIGTHPALSGNLVFPIPAYLDRVFVGYSRVFFPTELVHEARIGAGFAF